MQIIYMGESKDGHIKLTSDRDCLSPQIIRFDERVVVDDAHLAQVIAPFEARGYRVCIDTETMFYETGEGFRYGEPTGQKAR